MGNFDGDGGMMMLCDSSAVCSMRLQTTADGKLPGTSADLDPALFFTTVTLNMTEADVTARFKALYAKDIKSALPGMA